MDSTWMDGKRAKAIEVHYTIRVLREVCKVVVKQRMNHNLDLMDQFSRKMDLDPLLVRIKHYRNIQKSVEFPEKARDRTISRTRQVIYEMYGRSRKKAISFAGIGTPKIVYTVGARGPVSNYSVYVGWGWLKNVYDQFYKDLKLEHDEYFVLTCEEVRTNHRGIRLFEANAYHFQLKGGVKVYIGQVAVGKQKAVIRKTASQAIESAVRLYHKQMVKTMTQQGED